MKYFHLLGDRKQLFEEFVKRYSLQLTNDFKSDFEGVIRSALQDINKPLIQSSEDEAVLQDAVLWTQELGKLYHELDTAFNQHQQRVQTLKEQLSNAMW